MIVLWTMVIFFFLLIVVYTVVSGLLVLHGWFKKRRAIRNGFGNAIAIQIDDAMDKAKNRWFVISIVLIFFVIAPFLAFLMIFSE